MRVFGNNKSAGRPVLLTDLTSANEGKRRSETVNIKWSNMSGFGPSAWNQSHSLAAVRVTLSGTGRKSGAAGKNQRAPEVPLDPTGERGNERTAA